ncbi:MAG TPA: hypothetical protein VM032_10295 [Vicinamibacterales bacterium]|nr:hypothetical protein [Vicinamibacterales bacterium]
MRTAEAWVLYAGDPAAPVPGTLQLEEFPIGDPGPDDVLVEPIYGCWEANMSHALARRPIDVARARGEARVVLGNSALLRVRETGSAVRHLAEGDLCVVNGARWDRFGYPEQVWAYDWPGTVGFLARQLVMPSGAVEAIPRVTRFSPMEWASFGVRYGTAYSNWQTAYGCWRTQMPEDTMAEPFVWTWGGGSSLGTAHLARVLGFPAVMVTGSDRGRALCARLGIQTLDRREFPDLSYDEARFASDAAYRKAYRISEDAFHARVMDMTDQLGASIFIDYLGSPVVRATLRVLGRQGVISTAGWKFGMSITSMRAIECIRRHVHVHTHFVRRGEMARAVAFAEERGWMVPRSPDDRIWHWDEIPALAAAYGAGNADDYFPLFEVNPL